MAAGHTVGAAETREASGQLADVLVRNLEREILKAVATGSPLSETMGLLCRRVEEIVPFTLCSVLAVDESGRLQHLASPSLPEHYSKAVDGLAIGPTAGSCGTAAYRNEPVEVTDIATDPLWADYKSLALPVGLRACWSSPITSGGGRVIGTFAFYYRTPRGPGPLERQIVATCLHYCAIAIEHEEAQAKIHDLAYRDPLTGLPNRASFHNRVLEALAAARSSQRSVAIHYIDLDDFKGVNDTLGHSVGDRLLRAVAERLVACAANGASVARLGGDEFAILQDAVEDLGEISGLAMSVIAAFAHPFHIESHKIRISASSGIARMPDDGDDPEELLRKADLALYRAKGEGRKRFQLFTQEMDAALQTRRALENDLRLAVERPSFELVYQPIIDLESGDVTTVEALLRWHRPGWGTVTPDDFIPVAEETGLIEDIGSWVLHEACLCAATWPPQIKVAINLSLRQFRQERFVFNVIRTLNRTSVPPRRLELEITESVLLSNQRSVRAALQELNAVGIQIALDDFGTGYSSLSYLRSFPFNKIKIDKSFVADLGCSPGSTAIIRAVVGLARDLGMKTTAEGVETREQLDLLRLEGCSEVQGYYISRPQSAAAISALLQVPHLEPAAGRAGR